MSQKKIMDLTEVQSVDENLCYVPVDNGSATVRIKLHNLEASATESAESYAQAAAASATSASGYADAAALSSASAGTYATNASESAQDAALSAGSASNSADAAAVSASNAASSARNVAAIVTDVSQQAAVALASAKEAKSFAVGGTDTRAGEDTDNAKWYSIQAGTSASNAATSATNAASSEANAAASESNAATSETNASSSETNAATSATNAASSETNAGASATAAALSEAAAALSRAAAATSSEDAEAWSVGTRNNVQVPSTDPAYHNNAKYWAEAAAGAASGGVTSFNGRAGAVSSQAHDYSANQVDFNNADNGFIATNTQAAIEEVAGNLSDLDTSLASVAKSGSYNDLSNTPNLATVATSGSYADLSNTPTLGTAAAKNSTNTISSGSTDLIESGAVNSLKQTLENAISDEVTARTNADALKADKADLASISITGSTNNTGSTIYRGTFFYKSGVLVRAKLDIASGATLTLNTNYEVVNEGVNSIQKAISNVWGTTVNVTIGVDYTCPSDGVITIGAYTPIQAQIIVNGIAVSSLDLTSQATATYTRRASWRVNKGDVIRVGVIDGTLSVSMFVPTL